MIKRALSLTFLILVASLPGLAQPPQRPNSNSAFISGTVVLSPDEEGGQEVPGAGVVVTVISGKDTLHAVADDRRGAFMIRNVKTGKAFVSFSLMGYKTLAKTVDIVPGQNRMIANLEPDFFSMDEAVIKEDIAAASLIADTIIFNAAAVKVNKGEKAIDILEQMPGVSVGESSVTVLDEEVKNVYVDGALLFGKAPMNALNNLDADDIRQLYEADQWILLFADFWI